MHDPVRTVGRQVWRDGSLTEGPRTIPEETALALTYNGGTYAVMMGTPQDLEDFAIGFSLNEGIIQSLDDIDSLRRLISYTSWVKYVVRQYGFYLLEEIRIK